MILQGLVVFLLSLENVNPIHIQGKSALRVYYSILQ